MRKIEWEIIEQTFSTFDIYVVNEQSIISVSISQVEDPIISGILAGLGPIKDFIFNDTYGILAQGINGLAL